MCVRGIPKTVRYYETGIKRVMGHKPLLFYADYKEEKIMCYKAFTEDVTRRVQERLGDDVTVHLTEVLKNNGEKYTGLSVQENDQVTAPLLDLKKFYETYQDDPDMERCADTVLQAYEHQKTEGMGITASQFWQVVHSWDSVKEHIQPFLLSIKWNRELMERLVCTPFLDLAICYQICLDSGDVGMMTLQVDKHLLGKWHISKKELHEQAILNMEQEGYGIIRMSDIAGAGIDGAEEIAQTEEMTGFAIMTNRRRKYGAAGILKKELLQDYAAKYDQNLILLPSSIHEFVIFTDDGTADRAYMNGMVREVNLQAVLSEERLGDHGYYYDRKKNTITELV